MVDRLARVAAALILLSGFGCAAYGVEREVEVRELTAMGLPTLALTPPRLLMAHAPYQVYQLASDVAEVLAVDGGLPVVAPWEYDPAGELAEQGESERVLVALAGHPALPGRDVLVVHLTVEESAVSRDMREPLAMGGEIERHYEAEVRVSLTARTFPRCEPVARVSVEFEDPPFHDDATPANPRPMLREGVREAARQLVDLLGDEGLSPAPGRPPEVALTVNPRQVFEYGAGERLSLGLAELDELDRLAQSLVYYQYFEPELDGGVLREFEAAPEPGLLVGTVEEEVGLREGDYIVSVDGQAVSGIQVWVRAFAQRRVGELVGIEVMRAGEVLRLEIPVWAR